MIDQSSTAARAHREPSVNLCRQETQWLGWMRDDVDPPVDRLHGLFATEIRPTDSPSPPALGYENLRVRAEFVPPEGREGGRLISFGSRERRTLTLLHY